MARLSRVEVFAPDEIAIVHVMNRTVRRCFLMGNDPLTGKNYDHRKCWLENELVRLAAQFGIDLLCQAILDNHFHLVLRSRPDVVATWDDREVARRWLMLCPPRKNDAGQAEEPNEFELNSIQNNPSKLATIRSRLSDISWWMRLLCQKVAQRSNRDDREIGKFWQARFRAVRLLDEASILACAAYVDLNPIRAAIAQTLEQSNFTSVQKRIRDLQESVVQVADPHRSAQEIDGPSSSNSARDRSLQPTSPSASDASYLSPLEIDERLDAVGPRSHRQGRRCSDKGFLPLTTAAYVELLDWTARQIRSDKRGSTPLSLQPIFDRLGIGVEAWCGLVKDFGRLFYAMAGKPHEIDARRSRDGRHRYKTKRQARELLAVA